MTAQRFDPFSVPDETHCGDCDRVLTSATEGRLESAYIHDGIRCQACYSNYLIAKAAGLYILPVITPAEADEPEAGDLSQSDTI